MKGGPILLVEDNPDDEVLLLRTLKKASLANEVVVARDGAEALDHLFGTGVHEGREPLKPALILLDIDLPKIGGLEVLKHLRKDKRTRRLPVVILTSSGAPRHIVRSYELGANRYVNKPMKLDEFCEALRQLGLDGLLPSEPAPDGS